VFTNNGSIVLPPWPNLTPQQIETILADLQSSQNSTFMAREQLTACQNNSLVLHNALSTQSAQILTLQSQVYAITNEIDGCLIDLQQYIDGNATNALQQCQTGLLSCEKLLVSSNNVSCNNNLNFVTSAYSGCMVSLGEEAKALQDCETGVVYHPGFVCNNNQPTPISVALANQNISGSIDNWLTLCPFTLFDVSYNNITVFPSFLIYEPGAVINLSNNPASVLPELIPAPQSRRRKRSQYNNVEVVFNAAQAADVARWK